METSLIGKALNFGFNEYGFESRVSNLKNLYCYSYLINQINLNIAKKKLKLKINYKLNIIKILAIFKNSGLILNYNFKIIKKKKYITIYLCFYKNMTFFKKFKLISKPSKSYFISNKMLKLLNKKIFNTTFILLTNKEVVNLDTAIKLNLGGKILMIVQ